jgi:hypothetical protein
VLAVVENQGVKSAVKLGFGALQDHSCILGREMVHDIYQLPFRHKAAEARAAHGG